MNAIQHDGGRRPDEIMAVIERTRSEMDSTLKAIEHRLTPGQLVDQGLEYLRHSGANEFISNLGGSVKQNPLPVALVGLGLAWLMAADRGARSGGEWHSGVGAVAELAEGQSSGGRMQSIAGQAQDRMEQMSELATGGKDALSRQAQGVRQQAQRLRERAGRMGQAARERVEQARGSYRSVLEEQPLVLGALGVAAGALLAAMLPRSRPEDELMGEARDRLARQAQAAGEAQVERAQQAMPTQATAGGDAKAGKPASASGAPEASRPGRPAPPPPS